MKRGMKVLLSLALLLFCGLAVPSNALAYTASSSSEELAQLTLVAETDGRALYLDEENAVLRWVDLESGVAVDTKLIDGDSGNENYKAYQKSDFIISYWDNSSGTNTSTTTTQTNYAKAVANGQVEYEMIENGVRVTYTLKEETLSMDVVPKYISEERMEELVYAYLTYDEREYLADYYRLYNGYYTRTKDGSSGITQSTIRYIQSLFYDTGAYTEEDLAYDNEMYGYESTWSNIEIVVSLEYTLDGEDLLITLPMERLTINKEDIVINTITLMSYFLSATQEEDGYFVVPDGSGAIIEFNNGMTNATDYVSRVYGKDVLVDADTGDTTEYYANMPIIGAVYENYAILNIVEEGDAMAEINARISGKQDNYNNAFFKFYITESENISTASTSGTSVIKYTGDTYTGDIVLRYKLYTEEEELNYTSLAKSYQEYLIEKGVLSLQEDATEASLVLELFGSALESKSFMGVPYYGVTSFTSYSEAEEIIRSLAESGVDNAVIQMDGWLDGGESHELLTSAGLESNQGSKKAFLSLVAAAEELGFDFFPDIELELLNPSFSFLGASAKSYARNNGSRLLDNDYAQFREADVGTNGGTTDWKWTPYLLSPTNLLKYVQKAVKNLSGYGLSGYTVTDLGNYLIADYNEKASVSRQSATELVQEAVEELSESATVAMKSPYQYAWTNVTVMTDLPTRSNQYRIFNQDIPFLQLVLDGCVSYSTEPLNDSPEKDTEVMLMTCIESRSNPKFYLMAAEMEDLKYLADKNIQKSSINYDTWEETMLEIYTEYAAFSEQVEGSYIISHEYLADNVVCVGYDNGVCVYLNYNENEVTVDGHTLAGESYLIVKEG